MLFLFLVRSYLKISSVWTSIENPPMAPYQVCLQSESILQFASVFIKKLV